MLPGTFLIWLHVGLFFKNFFMTLNPLTPEMQRLILFSNSLIFPCVFFPFTNLTNEVVCSYNLFGRYHIGIVRRSYM